jgi:hypothetical protein
MSSESKKRKNLPAAEDQSRNETKQLFYETPRICLIDVDKMTSDLLKSKGFNCTSGSLGQRLSVPNQRQGQLQLCGFQFEFPQNLHEYQILVVDLATTGEKPFIPDPSLASIIGKSHKDSQIAFICEYPTTIFDPRPLSSHYLASEVQKLLTKDFILILFVSNNVEVNYKPVYIEFNEPKRKKEVLHNLFDIYPYLIYNEVRYGLEIHINTQLDSDLYAFVKKYKTDFFYEVVFRASKDRNFIPLIFNNDGDIVSFMAIHKQSSCFVFPQLNDKTTFLSDLFLNILPQIHPNLFPDLTKFKWLEEQRYRLPNENILIEKRSALERDFKVNLQTIECEFEENRLKYSFLHNLLTGTGKELVAAVVYFLERLGFENVMNVDEEMPNLKEEDIRVELDDGILIVEVKGIVGTSRDDECSQVSKYRHRRCKERGAFDVRALYLVNHQRHLPPVDRANPPFNEKQITDAEDDDRGLLSTWELFKTYFWIEDGYITQADVREQLLKKGLVTFSPSNSISLGKPDEILYKGFVVVLNVDVSVRVGDTILAVDGEGIRQLRITEIQVDGKDLLEATGGCVGLKLSDSVSKNSELWLKVQ